MELSLDKYIHKLLFKHNCVIIPSFGGFVSNYKGAEIHPTQHIFASPCKQLVFNKNLIVNDGLLASIIAQEEHVSYQEAIDIIDKDVFKIKHMLSAGEKVMLNAIGYLRLDVEKNIQFSPASNVNYATSSYGLQNFQSSAIQRGGYAAQVEKTFKDRPAIKSKTNSKQYRKYALPLLLLPFALALFFYPFSSVLKDKVHMQTSGYFSKAPAKFYQAQAHQFELAMAKIEPMKVLEESPVAVLADNNDALAMAETTMVSAALVQQTTALEQGDFTLISGCFAVLENAEKQIAQLKLKHIDARVIGQSKSGLYRVGCGSFASVTEANQAMNNLKEQQTEVWVLKN